jgi:hypothetical protein
LDFGKDAIDMKRILFCATLQLICLSAAAAEIRLKDQAVCSGSLVRLGDVADIVTAGEVAQVASDDATLGNLVLFPAPGTGRTLELTRQELRQLLALCDVDPRTCQLTGADTVVISAEQSPTRSIVRPALHLIPSRAYIDKPTAAANKPANSTTDEPAKLVERNGAVTIHSIWPGVKITASGKSLADAALGESVLVVQTDSKEKLLAKVVGPQIVEVRPETK